MEKIISLQNLRSFAYCNHAICLRPIRGIVVSFCGLNHTTMFHEDTEEGKFFAELGILFLVPYQNPWSWMNRQSVALTDELMDVLFDAFDLADDLPIVYTGRSMGGLSALVYSAYAGRTPAACVVNCPVCDLPYHFSERGDLPRSLYSAFFSYEGTMEEALRSASPLHLTEQLPTTTDYCIFHCEKDTAVNKEMHSDRFVEQMRQKHHVQYFTIPEMGHCNLTAQMRQLYNACVIAPICGKVLCDCHLHSRNSHDSTQPLVGSAQAAVERNIDVITLTDHCDIQYYLERDVRGNIARSLKEAGETAAEFDGKLKVLKGIEIGDSLWNKSYAEEILERHEYDEVIGSVHAVKSECDGEPYSQVDFGQLSEEDIDRYMRQYFKDVLETLMFLPCDVMAHLTCPMRYINEKYGWKIDSRRYEAEILPILEYIIENNIAMEINTSGVDLSPSEWIVAKYREMGGFLITLGADAHVAENVGKDLYKAIALLKKYDFKTYCYYQNRRPVPCLL